MPSAGYGSIFPNADNWLGVVEQEYELDFHKRRIIFARGGIGIALVEIVSRTMHFAEASFRSMVPGGLKVLYMCIIACCIIVLGLDGYGACFNIRAADVKQASATRVLSQRSRKTACGPRFD